MKRFSTSFLAVSLCLFGFGCNGFGDSSSDSADDDSDNTPAVPHDLCGVTAPEGWKAEGFGNSDWSRRRALTFVNDTGEALSNFVVTLKLDATRIDYSLTQDLGQDLRFIDPSDPTTLLPHEVIEWNENGVSLVAVRVPLIDMGETDSVLMYYGNANAVSVANGPCVFGEDYLGVWHMAEATGSAALNSATGSTGSTYQTSAGGAPEAMTAVERPKPPVGLLGSTAGVEIDGDATGACIACQYLQTDSVALKTAPEITASIWFKSKIDFPTEGYGNKGLMLLWQGPVQANGFGNTTALDGEVELHMHLGDPVPAPGDDISEALVSAWYGTDQGPDVVGGQLRASTPVTEGTYSDWHQLTTTITGLASGLDGTPVVTLYLDGQPVAQGVGNGLHTTREFWDTPLRIGRPGARTRYFPGTLGEARILGKVFSDAWIAAQFAAQSDALTRFGEEEVP